MSKISKTAYDNIAGADWPSYDDYLADKINSTVQQEIGRFIKPVIPIIPQSAPYKQQSDPNVAYQYVLNSFPRGKDYPDKIVHTCNRPSRAVTIDMFTNCLLCVCDGWISKPVGKITDFARLEDIWDNSTAYELQEDVTSKKFTWCAIKHCGITERDNIEQNYQLVFGIDDSCNLKCPSCRREARMYESGPLFDEKLNAVQHTVNLLNDFEEPIHITLACSGDPLASNIYRPLLHSYIGKSSQTFTLFTNGLLIKKQLDKTKLIERITNFRISVDAGSKEVYEKVRLGGKWEILKENLDFLKEKKLSNAIDLVFIVQKNNFRDILNFQALCQEYDVRGALVNLDDWGTWVNTKIETPDDWTLEHGTYMHNNVLAPDHPDFEECKQIIGQVTYKKLSKSFRLIDLINKSKT